MQSVLINYKKLEVIGPFESLEAAQTFRREHDNEFGDFLAIPVRSPEVALMVANSR